MHCQTLLYAVLRSLVCGAIVQGQTPPPPERFNGLDMNLGNLSAAVQRPIALDQPGELHRRKGQGRHGHRRHRQEAPRASWARAGRSRPRSASRRKSTFTMAEINGSGRDPADLDDARAHRQNPPVHPALLLGRRDGTVGGSARWAISSLAAGASIARSTRCPCASIPGSAFNCYWTMPFRKKAKITLENLGDKDMTLYYQVNYTLTDVPADAAYFHAQFRRVEQA